MGEPKYIKCQCQNCAGNIEFPEDAAGTEVSCPHCAWKTLLVPPTVPIIENPTRKKNISWIVTLAVVASMAAAIGLFQWQRSRVHGERDGLNSPTSHSTRPETVDKPTVTTNNLTVGMISLEKTTNSSLVYAVGTVRNISEQQRFGIKIELELLDTDGAKIGTASDYLAILEPKAAWKFKALVLEKKAATAKFATIKEEL